MTVEININRKIHGLKFGDLESEEFYLDRDGDLGIYIGVLERFVSLPSGTVFNKDNAQFIEPLTHIDVVISEARGK